MFRVETHDERLICVRVDACETVERAQVLAQEVSAAISRASGPVVAAADFRRTKLFSLEVTEVFIKLLKSDNPRIERAAHVIGSGVAFGLQIDRMVREAANPRRRVFRTVVEAEAYLAEHLTTSQRTWLHTWFAAAGP